MSSMHAVFCSWQGRLEILRKAQWQSSPPVKPQKEFIKGDPFVTNGLVSKWRLVEWNAAFI